MKKFGIILLAFLFSTGISIAQERGAGQRPSKAAETTGQGQRGDRQNMNPEEMLKRQTARLVEELKLNKDQETKVTAINKKYWDKQSADWAKMREASDEERQKMRESMRTIQAAKDKEIKAVLTADQVKLYDDMLKRREEMRRNGMGRNAGQGNR